jgi:hypothetical protein
MIFRQITHDDLGCASCLIADEHAGLAAVVDPRFEIDEYLELARYMGVRIEHIRARGIFRSLTRKLLTLPEACEVWPVTSAVPCAGDRP